ncbi:NEL-type E3 ubiquitin ligase domain-containing protein [Pseudomonas purpurea]|uniref:NEL-type E3 ubiquitin ligase domain-containing protein n=1 Tax=Pseudomonas purpurea TaxID=3136737 RepID=UPI0032679FE4
MSRLLSLDTANPTYPDWYMNASSLNRRYLKQLVEERWRSQAKVDGPLKNLQQDIQAFANPLLSLLVRSNFNTHGDVSPLTLKLYIPDNIIFGIDSGASRVRESTLLEGALHNFEEPETAEDYFRTGSGVYSRNSRGELTLERTMTVAKIATLCRRLDLGGQYQTHIKSILLPSDPKARQLLEEHALAAHKASFNLDALMAYLKKDISEYAYGKLKHVRDGKSDITFHDQPLHRHRLSLMGFALHGIVLFSAVSQPSRVKSLVDELTPDGVKFWSNWSQRLPVLPGTEYERFKLLQSFLANGPDSVHEDMLRREDVHRQSRLDGPVIAYVPDDPLHPLKEYNSLADFMKELLGQLRDTQYQEFFSRFVAQKDKGKFFARVNERLTRIVWQQREPLDMGPWWRETELENPTAEPITNLITGDLWQWLYADKRDKAIADARVIAVPTGDEDATTRWKRLTSYLDIGWNVFNFVGMLIPGVGEVLLGVMVAQIADELVEGIEDWSKGDREEAASHINGVLINFAQLALMGVGHVLPRGLAAVKPSALIDSLKPVEMPDGKTRLWKTDLGPYEHPVSLPANAVPNDIGLFEQGGKQWLRLEEKHYEVSQDPVTGQHRLEHPQRPTAYKPLVEHNNAGAWKVETERPLEWEAQQLMQRMDTTLHGYSAQTLGRIQRVSGVDENLLRRLHVEHETPPALLRDTCMRFNTYAEAERFPQHIEANQIPDAMVGFVPEVMVELPGWPENRAVEVFEAADRSGASFKHGNAMASGPMTIKVSRSELAAGKLPERVIEALDDSEVRVLLGNDIARGTPERIEALRKQLGQQAGKQKKRLFEALYKSRDVSGDPRVRRVLNDVPELPASVALELLEHAEPADLQHLSEKQRLSLRLRQQARAVRDRVRLNRAYEGLYLEELASADSRRLELGSLAGLPGWSDEVRIEIRELGFGGKLHASVGPENAPIRKVLILEEDGRYQTRDADDRHLHGTDEFYASVLHALPDAQRNALGYDIHEGARLKVEIQRSPLSHDRFASTLLEHPIRKPAYDPHTLKLLGGMDGYRRVSRDMTARLRIRSLYPSLTDAELDMFMETLRQQNIPVGLQIHGLEIEFNQMVSTLNQWVNRPLRDFRFGPRGVAERNARNAIAAKIRRCWQRSGPWHLDGYGNATGQALDLSNLDLSPHIDSLPRLAANFDHVTRLGLSNTGLSSIEHPFLQSFRNVRALDLARNSLTALPSSLAEMPHLRELDLTSNRVVLNIVDHQRLKKCTLLTSLKLAENPLELLPNISRMPDLHTLVLANTGATTWPPGLFDRPRFRHFFLDLSRNVLTDIPQVTPGTWHAEMLGRTWLSRGPEWMSAENLETLKNYVRSVGMDPERPYPPAGVLSSIQWEEGLTRPQWVEKQYVWNDVEDEFNSTDFFEEINALTLSADFTASKAYRADLTGKVWRMLDTMAENAPLREQFFREANVRSNCVDGATQLFNVMGVQVLVHEALALGNSGLIEAELVTLAQGKSRLDELERIARRHIVAREAAGERFRREDAARNVTGTIDEVEVHLAFMTDLAERLDLPWQARGMQFRKIAGVTSEMIEDAYQRVLGLEEGDLLRDSIAEQSFWKSFVERSNRARFRAIDRKTVATTEFKVALDERADSAGLSLEEKASLKEQIRVLAAELGQPESAFAPGQVMADEAYEQELALIKSEREALLRQLTQQAMDRAKVQRVEIPFTVAPGS